MTTSNRTSSTSAEIRRPSRAEIESLCIVHAIGQTGCTLGNLPARLGLCPTLAPAMKEAVAPLVAAGHVELRDDTVCATPAGWVWLQSR
ncbi:MAG TPA: hypothetical protein PKD61_10530, partial [Polyangiaceae bacterium]|nr:hypothetical protein [Polyangiaceae bacterium]